MVSKNQKIDPDRISNINEVHINECPIDLELSLNPVMCSNCENLYCPDCIAGFTKCPMCNREDIHFKNTKNTIIEYYIGKILLTCKYKEYGCPFVFPYQTIDSHEKKCPYTTITCIYNECSNVIAKAKATNHLIYSCESKRIKCPLCKTHYYLSDLSDHIERCQPNYNICQFCGCWHLKEEENNCSYKIFTCKTCGLPEIGNTLKNNNHQCPANQLKTESKQQYRQILMNYLTTLTLRVESVFKEASIIQEEEKSFMMALIIGMQQECKDTLKIYENSILEMQKLMNKKIDDNTINTINDMNRRIGVLQKNIIKLTKLVSQYEKNAELIKEDIIAAHNQLENEFQISKIGKETHIQKLNDYMIAKVLDEQYPDETINPTPIPTPDEYYHYTDDGLNDNFNLFKLTPTPSNDGPVNGSNIKDSICGICNNKISECELLSCSNCYQSICNNCRAVCPMHYDDFLCMQCIKCCVVCDISLCPQCSKKCFYDKCTNHFCEKCYKKNEHHVRSNTSDCGYYRCKSCSKTGNCILTSIMCGKCSIRTCINCYKANHKGHNM